MKGHINLRKVHTPLGTDTGRNGPRTCLQYSAGSSQVKKALPHTPGYASHRRRGHVGKTMSHAHRNRSLVLNNVVSLSKRSEASVVANGEEMAYNAAKEDVQQSQITTSWVSKRDRHMQLINSAVYDKQANLRSKAINQSREERPFRKDQREMFKIHQHIQKTADSAATTLVTHQSAAEPAVHDLNIAGLRFRVSNGGSKLVRCPSALHVPKSFTADYLFLAEAEIARPTPRRALVGGVTFMRSRHGNLYRSGLVTSRRYKTFKLEFMCVTDFQ